MESLDNYLQPRNSISDNVENQYLLEVGGLCPLCGKKLLNDMSILKLTYLPILVHDSVLLKQIFIALDKMSSYSERSQEILNENAVLRLGSGENELFGRSWSKKG